MQSMHPTRFTDRPPNQLRLNLGNAFEQALVDALATAHPDRYHRLGTLEKLGRNGQPISGTPDLLDLRQAGDDPGDPANWGITEVKLTWASAKRADDPDSEWFWHYWAQIRPYCSMQGVNNGALIVCFINGRYSYSDDDGPVAYEWHDHWDDDELDEAWSMVDSYATVESPRSSFVKPKRGTKR
jgi:hypothetical protein